MGDLSENFSTYGFTKSQIATRLGIDNSPDAEQLACMVALTSNVLQPIRDHYDDAVVLSSGLRIMALNTAIQRLTNPGWDPETGRISQHVFGQAADFEINGLDNLELATWIRDNLEFDQLILEYYIAGIPNSGWVHCSYRATPPAVLNEGMGSMNRGEILRAERLPSGKTAYSYGLVAA